MNHIIRIQLKSVAEDGKSHMIDEGCVAAFDTEEEAKAVFKSIKEFSYQITGDIA